MTTARLAGAILAAFPAVAAAQPASFAAHALAAREVARPLAVAAAPAQAAAQQATALEHKLLQAQRPLAERQLYAIAGDERVRLTNENIGDVLKRSPLTAEHLGLIATRTAVPATLVARLGPAVQAFSLPTRFTALPLNGGGPVHFHVLFEVLDGLHYDGAAGKFVARLALALFDPARPEDTSELSHELPVLIAADAAVLTTPPNPTPLDEVRLRALNSPVVLHLAVEAPVDPYAVRALTALQQEPDSIVIAVSRPRIEIIPASTSIRGWGLEETEVTVRVAGAKGRPGEVVVVTSDPLGSLRPSRVPLDPASGTGVATLRSAGIGKATLKATDPRFDPGRTPVTVDFGWPVRFAFAVVLGGAVGALLRRNARRPLGRSLALGILSALVMGVAYAVGISLGVPTVPSGLAGEGVFFVVAALAGFLGRGALQRLAGASS